MLQNTSIFSMPILFLVQLDFSKNLSEEAIGEIRIMARIMLLLQQYFDAIWTEGAEPREWPIKMKLFSMLLSDLISPKLIDFKFFSNWITFSMSWYKFGSEELPWLRP